MNLKPFNLEEAKANPEMVVTQDGRKARIICTDRITNDNNKIIILIDNAGNFESVASCEDSGRNCYSDLMLLPVKKEGWVRLYWSIDKHDPFPGTTIYETKEKAEVADAKNFLCAAKIEWEE